MDPAVSELHIENAVCAWAEDNGWIAPKLQWVSQTGWPDRTFLKKGKNGGLMVAFIEFKKPKGRRRAKQIYWLKILVDLGANAIICDDPLVGIYFLKNIELENYD